MVQQTPMLNIRPDPFMSNRSEDSWKKHGGFLPIYEKENAFSFLSEYDQIAIVDADILIREDAPNIFEDFGTDKPFGAVCEREMNINDQYVQKIRNYSTMQYNMLHSKKTDFKPNDKGFEFFNMGLILLNSKLFRPYLNGQTPSEFITRYEFMDFVNGKGPWKWSTDQTLLNYFLKKYKIPTSHLDQKWNGLFTANKDISKCHFVHFFLKDLLPAKGENVEELMGLI
jgi:lipopolysaccharide biosynthesis glycosyltransferase|tara:strand:- start:1261 stop:1941 length:681 start_codon:yes stop_codon:yes gene_type:complete